MGDEPILGSQFEQIIDNLATTINNNYDNLANTIRDKNPQEITKSLNTYSEFINGKLVIDIHKKIIIEMAKKSKAITKE
ncbi:hypothetical protein [Acinetobacter bereziniae]|uniref:hypothetical protein n=1 Tax=Acinetobacter bereziniae TaxID=106648 RepID=UPI00208E2599|nr:hypothetical protein [Acinetobacter bereziniae]